MKLKKKSTLIGAISVLAGVSVVSVGFASWVVSAGDTVEVSGTISVENVEDQRHTITQVGNLPSDLRVKYGAPASAVSTTVPGEVLSYKNVAADEIEHLSIGTFTYTIANWASANLKLTVEESGNSNTARNWYRTKATGIIVDEANLPNDAVTSGEGQTHELAVSSKKGYAAALDLGLVGNLPSYNLGNGGTPSNVNVTIDTSADLVNSGKNVTFTLNFKWGTHFTGYFDSDLSDNTGDIHNPFTFYNGNSTPFYPNTQEGVELKNAAAKDAVASLKSLENLLANVSYKLTIQTEHFA